jgi:subtilisin family serine protease
MVKFFTLCLLIFISIESASAESSMIRLETGQTQQSYESEHHVKLKLVSTDLRLYEVLNETVFLNTDTPPFRRQSIKPTRLANVIPNHPVQMRSNAVVDLLPRTILSTDPLLPQQWNWSLTPNSIGINVAESWKHFGTGGKNALKQDIVVAIVDGGFDYRHPDLSFNRWRNWNEIAGNGIDDDSNGYIDDISGWNTQTNTAEIENADHGTHVAGLIGARGNNNRGIAGLNWRVKIMYVSMGQDLADTASTMRAYSYILKQKELWLATNGKKGANVVAINSSFGIDAQKCSDDDFVIWNEIFNRLGEKGILSVAATSNWNIDVDTFGDIPTSCDSPFLVSVTNSTRTGLKSEAGFGKIAIDLAAPGEDILSTGQRQFSSYPSPYSAQTGTSFSTPQVAGAVGYLHSVIPAERLSQKPSDLALAMKDILLRTVTPTLDLKKFTQTGGVLNVHAASLVFKQSNEVLASR